MKWLFFESIYGVAILMATAYIIAVAIRRFFAWFPRPEIFVFLALILGVTILPSIPKYQFEEVTISKFSGKDYIRVVKKYKSGTLLEPLTWFYTPVTSMLVIRPNLDVSEGGGYTETLFQYDKDPEIRIASPDCSQGTISYAEPDIKGVLSYVSFNKEMSKFETSLYCKYDWSKEKKALSKAASNAYEE